MASMKVSGREKCVQFHVDTGSSVNVLPGRYAPSDIVLQDTSTVLKSWTGNLIRPTGQCRLVVQNPKNNKKYRVPFIVVQEQLTPILGLKATEAMGLVSINENNIQAEQPVHSLKLETEQDVIAAYPGVFGAGIGTLPGIQHLQTDPSVRPRISPTRRVPYALSEQLADELKAMEKEGVIKRVEEPTPWENSLVTTEKANGKLRICIDPRHLNTALERERYPMKTLEDVLPKLQNCKVFSVVDLKSGYWHVRLDDESSLLTTFNSPNGRFRWCRLPFGLNVSSEIFQRRLEAALEGLEGVASVADDIFILGPGDTHADAVVAHDQNLQALLDRCLEQGIDQTQPG